jgi:muramidase (phage lysozyme)
VREQRANKFAAEFLIPPEYNANVQNINSHDEIVTLARKLEIAPGIVAGRYQFLTKKWHYFKAQIRTLQWNQA